MVPEVIVQCCIQENKFKSNCTNRYLHWLLYTNELSYKHYKTYLVYLENEKENTRLGQLSSRWTRDVRRTVAAVTDVNAFFCSLIWMEFHNPKSWCQISSIEPQVLLCVMGTVCQVCVFPSDRVTEANQGWEAMRKNHGFMREETSNFTRHPHLDVTANWSLSLRFQKRKAFSHTPHMKGEKSRTWTGFSLTKKY